MHEIMKMLAGWLDLAVRGVCVTLPTMKSSCAGPLQEACGKGAVAS